MKQILDIFQYQCFSMKKVFFQSIFVTFLFVIAQTAYSAPQYSVSPLIINTDIKARDIITKKITIRNIGDQPVTVFPTVNNISLKEGGEIEAFLPPAESDRTQSLASWIEISRLGIDLRPSDTKEIDLTLRINPNPVSGTYHAFIGFGYGRNRDEAEIQVKNGQAPGTVVTVNLEDEKVTFLKLSGFIIDRFITKSSNQAATFTFKNPGEEVLIPKGEIILYDSRGAEVANLPINDENTTIQAGEEHTFIAQVPIEGMFGKYKAFLSVEYGSTQRGSVQDTTFFYVFPVKIIFLILTVILLIVGWGALHVHKKYLDGDSDDSDRLTFHVRDVASGPQHHDVNLKDIL